MSGEELKTEFMGLSFKDFIICFMLCSRERTKTFPSLQDNIWHRFLFSLRCNLESVVKDSYLVSIIGEFEWDTKWGGCYNFGQAIFGLGYLCEVTSDGRIRLREKETSFAASKFTEKELNSQVIARAVKLAGDFEGFFDNYEN